MRRERARFARAPSTPSGGAQMARARRRCPVTERSVLASCVRSARSSISGSLPSDRHQSHRGEPLGIHEVRTPQGTITFDLFVRARPGRAVLGAKTDSHHGPMRKPRARRSESEVDSSVAACPGATTTPAAYLRTATRASSNSGETALSCGRRPVPDLRGVPPGRGSRRTSDRRHRARPEPGEALRRVAQRHDPRQQ